MPGFCKLKLITGIGNKNQPSEKSKKANLPHGLYKHCIAYKFQCSDVLEFLGQVHGLILWIYFQLPFLS
jgi:hypothetical protein